MPDKTILGGSDELRQYIEVLVEDVVIEGNSFEKHESYLRRYSEVEGIDYNRLEARLLGLFKSAEELKTHGSKECECLVRQLGRECHISQGGIDKIISYIDKQITLPPNWSALFIEQLRQAYCHKDLRFLENAYSITAEIMTGAYDRNSKAIRYRSQTVLQYIANLKYIFNKNKNIDVTFEPDSLTGVLYTSDDGRCQVVRLLQHWHSDNYSDRGYLFLKLYADQNGPKIYIRAWQPEFIDGKHITTQELYGS